MKCPSCGGAELVPDKRGFDFTYKGVSHRLGDVTGEYCPACDEGLLDMAECQRISDLMSDCRKRVNAGLVDPEFIAGVRRKLNLDQREAAAIFGGGVNAFSRYETGKSKPPVALVKLLKVLDRHPELLDEVRVA
ncbi:MAG: antitoxin [Lysobacteraceae bacterium]|nr:MAG: antitoxin [Xanthomonadaceae bacterium]